MIRILEDDPVTNAGTGSNLNLNGQVECDASIMNGTTLGFGSVGAVSDFKNPISVAAKVLQESDQGPLSLGRIPPLLLVGSGITQWVETMGFSTLESVRPLATTTTDGTREEAGSGIEAGPTEGSTLEQRSVNGSLVTYESLQNHIRFQTMLQKAATTSHGEGSLTARLDQDLDGGNVSISPSDNPTGNTKRKAVEDPLVASILSSPTSSSAPPPTTFKKRILEGQQAEDHNDAVKGCLQDTVGAICIDENGRVAAGVSSGGIAMKFPGRVSEAALFGAGCWAQDPSEESPGFACSMTGAGEQISKTLLAKTCMDTFYGEDDTAHAANTVLDRFMASPLLRSYEGRHAGFIAVKWSLKDGGSPEPDSDGDQQEQQDTHEMDDNAPRIVEFIFAHTTKTMGVAFMSAHDKKPTAIMSQRKPECTKTVCTRMVKI
ncbi:taspase, threonine aspartase, 1 [Mortierella sp. NVP85]|nr:taspase, threonine aspartase, 1 [Mortierella sp. NVP85]